MRTFFSRTARLETGAPVPPPPPETPEERLDQLSRLAAEADVIRQRRDRAIYLLAGQTRQRQVAAATGLSIARIKQIQQQGPAPQGWPRDAAKSPATEVDLPAADAPADARAERTFLLTDVAPSLEPVASEREFFAQNRARGSGYDVHHDISDTGADRWVVAIATGTGELYAFQADGVSEGPPEPARDEWGPGASSGPLYVLGRLPPHYRRFAAVAFNPQSIRLTGRPGGLAWIYGRAQLLNAVLQLVTSPYGDIDSLRTYVATLPLSPEQD